MKVHPWLIRFFNSRFFVVSCVLHLVLVCTIGTRMLMDRPTEVAAGPIGDIEVENGTFCPVGDSPRPDTDLPKIDTAELSNSLAENLGDLVQTTASADFGVAPAVGTYSGATSVSMQMPVQRRIESFGPGDRELTPEMKRDIATFTKWRVQDSNSSDPRYRFSVFLARYSGGDWNCTVEVKEGKILGGSLSNLLWIVRRLSKDRIQGEAEAEPLDLSTDALFSKRPPFVLFTGHRDFVLTEREVENLQKYIRLGGCIWGDSSLPGERSRFDLAFRREMKRVVPDADKPFQPLSSLDPLFRTGFYPQITSVPPGMQGYRLPVEALRFAGRVCVLYTRNDYADLWRFGLNDQWEFELGRDAQYRFVAMDKGLWDRREVYYHGITPQRVKASYQFGLNIIAHLVTRWETTPPRFPSGL